jgi:DNA helicase-2/ATP-dependent DNA helicase PcrA
MNFEARYKKLNDAQRLAVDTIDGPVMVIAGPGTGKTELLGMRAANILKKTDVLPENILCLTFTEAGSIAMKKRLIDIIGRDAYNVSIFTFHSFGTEIIGKYREYFFSGADFRPADELARHRIVTEILDSLEYNDPLKSKMNGKYTAIGDIISAISDLKRAGLTDGEFGRLLDGAQATGEIAGKLLSEVFASRVSKATLAGLDGIANQIESIEEAVPVQGVMPLCEVLSHSLRHACEAASAHPKTTPPLTSWKKEWMTNADDGAPILKVQKSLPKLRSLNHVYSLYLQIMQEAELIDFDDMIMQVIHAVEVNDDLRFDLQEKYQYIMVDEFQDTNLAQMRILHNLISNPVVEDTPNILVVGDDDQAIYGFQGAEVGNILYFKEKYPRTTLITLKENYRSVQTILDGARQIITQGTERLENHMKELDKTLRSHLESDYTAEVVSLATAHEERKWVANSVRTLLDNGTRASEIAIIARKHADLTSLLSCLSDRQVSISYDRRDNVLDDDVIEQMEHVGRTILALAVGQHEEANALLPEILSHPAWGIPPDVVWQISLRAHRDKKYWLEIMQEHEVTKQLFTWLVAASAESLHLPLERILDVIIGNASLNDSYTSPLKEHYFSESERQRNLSSYTAHLENLSTIRGRLRDHAVHIQAPKLADFLEFMEQNREAGTRITSFRHIGEDDTSVRLLTAHGSKGLEFDHVFIVNATDPMWGEKATGIHSAIAFPPHLRLRKDTDDYDERLRLFYVAMTRARRGLYISYGDETDTGKEVLPASFLLGSPLIRREVPADTTTGAAEEAASQLWYAPIINIPEVSQREYLAPLLQTYKLSATHVNSFLDVTRGGPQHFLLNTLLRFPSAPSAVASFGIAIHSTLQKAHDHMRAHESHMPEEDILHEFETIIERMEFTDDERRQYLHKGSDALRAFLKARYDSFSPQQRAELDFARQEVNLEGVHLTGKLDVVEFDKVELSAKVIDYKTGGALASWDKGQPHQKIRAHKYRQQLLFYKLLIENSRDWRKYKMTEGTLQFVEPDATGNIVDLTIRDIDGEELDRFTRLVSAVWKHINDLSFPDTSVYEPTIRGIKQFEDDLLTETI